MVKERIQVRRIIGRRNIEKEIKKKGRIRKEWMEEKEKNEHSRRG